MARKRLEPVELSIGDTCYHILNCSCAKVRCMAHEDLSAKNYKMKAVFEKNTKETSELYHRCYKIYEKKLTENLVNKLGKTVFADLNSAIVKAKKLANIN